MKDNKPEIPNNTTIPKKYLTLAVCIKEYQDEDDLDDFENGEIEEDEIRTYKVGQEGYVHKEFYSNEYWELK